MSNGFATWLGYKNYIALSDYERNGFILWQYVDTRIDCQITPLAKHRAQTTVLVSGRIAAN